MRYALAGLKLMHFFLQARIEGNPANMAEFRVTLASEAPQLSMQLKDLLVQHIRSA